MSARRALRVVAGPTPLQRVQRRFVDAFQAAREELDEDEFRVLLDIVTRTVARIHAERIERERRRAA